MAIYLPLCILQGQENGSFNKVDHWEERILMHIYHFHTIIQVGVCYELSQVVIVDKKVYLTPSCRKFVTHKCLQCCVQGNSLHLRS